jgi:hypothetical protein
VPEIAPAPCWCPPGVTPNQKEEDLEDEGIEAEGRSDREGERHALQCYLALDPNEARIEGEGEDQRAHTHCL